MTDKQESKSYRMNITRNQFTALVLSAIMAFSMIGMGVAVSPAVADETESTGDRPDIAASYYGEVMIGDNPASEGTEITAVDDEGNELGSIEVGDDGWYGGPTIDDDKLTVPEDSDVNIEEGDRIGFEVAGIEAKASPEGTSEFQETIEWEEGDSQQVDLSISTDFDVDIFEDAPLTLRYDEEGATNVEIGKLELKDETQNRIVDAERNTTSVFDEGTEIEFDFSKPDVASGDHPEDEDAQLIISKFEQPLDDRDEVEDFVRFNAPVADSYDIVDDVEIDSDGEATIPYQFDESGQYAVHLVTGDSFEVSNGNLLQEEGADATIVGVEHVAVQAESGEINPETEFIQPGDSLDVEVDSNLGVSGVDHGLLLYDAETLAELEFLLKTDERDLDKISEDNLTLNHSIESVSGVADVDEGHSVFDMIDMNVSDLSFSGTVTSAELFDELFNQTDEIDRIEDNIDDPDEAVIFNASAVTAADKDSATNLTIETLEEWGTGEYELLYTAQQDDDLTTLSTQTETITVADLEEINLELDDDEILEGDSTTATVTAEYSDGSEIDVSDEADITSDDTDIATVEGTTITGESDGTVTIEAEFNGAVDTAELTVEEEDEAAPPAPRPPATPDNPTAEFTVNPENPVVGEFVTLDASASVPGEDEIVRFDWEVDGEEIGTGEILNHSFDEAGEVEITLTVENDQSQTDTTSQTITVEEIPSEPRELTPEEIRERVAVPDDVEPTRGEDASVVEDNETGERSVTFSPRSTARSISFSDNQTTGTATAVDYPRTSNVTGPSPGTTASVTQFAVPNPNQSATVTFGISADRLDEINASDDQLRVNRHDDGWTTLDTETERVGDEVIVTAETPGFSFFTVSAVEQPEAVIDIDPAEPVAGEEVTLDGSDSLPGEDEIVSYDWEVNGDEYEGETVTHTFDEAGEYNVTLTVENNAGETNTSTETVQVSEAPPEEYELTVEVEDEAGNPIENADVTVDGEQAVTDADGTALFELVEGTYTVEADADGFEPASEEVTIEDDDTVVLTLTEEVEPVEEYDLTVEVTDEDGDAIEDATVTVNGDEATTGEEGMVSFQLPADEYDIDVEADGYEPATETVDLDEDTTVTIELVEEDIEEDDGIGLLAILLILGVLLIAAGVAIYYYTQQQ